MTTLQWITAFAASMMSPLLTWPAAGLIVWAMFAFRVSMRHDVSMEDFKLANGQIDRNLAMEDIPDRGEKI